MCNDYQQVDHIISLFCLFLADPAIAVFKGSCGLRPPPSSMVFTFMVAIICLIIGLPVDFLIGYVMDEYCSKRPEFEKIGESTVKWLGLATQDLHGRGEIEKSDLEEIFSDIERQQVESVRTRDTESAIQERKFRDMMHVTYRVYDDFLSPGEELDLLLRRTRLFDFRSRRRKFSAVETNGKAFVERQPNCS